MNKENKTHKESIDIVTQMARTAALKDGSHAPTLIVTGTEKSLVGQMDLPDTHEERAQLLFEAGFNLSQEEDFGMPMQVFFITEGWMSFPKDGKIEMLPSEDPERLEVLVIAGLYLLRAQHSLVVLEMIRDETEQLIELREHSRIVEDGQTESFLLNAFVMGYATGLSSDNNNQLSN